MTWARVDDAWWCHPKVLTLDLDARGLWVSALSWSCQQSTDQIPDAIVRMCGDDGTAAKKLVVAGLWDESDDGGWVIHDWDDYQSERAKKAAAGRKGGKKSGESRRASKQDDEADDGASHEAEPGASDEAGPTRPVPSLPNPKNATSPPDGDDPDVSEDARTLTREFAKAVKANGHGIPTQGSKARDSWLVEMDRLLRLGPPGEGSHVPDVGEVRRVITFVTHDSFEMANVRSVPKLRERYSQLRIKAGHGSTNGQQAGTVNGAVI